MKIEIAHRFWHRIFLTFTMLLLACLGFFGWVLIELNKSFRGYAETERVIEIPRGTPTRDIAETLKREGILRHKTPFFVALLVESKRHVLRAGEYLFDRPMTPREVLHKLIRGEVYFHEVTIPEGYNVFEIAAALEERKIVPKSEFLSIINRVELVRDLSPHAFTLEGFLFPDTYRFEKNTSALDVAKTMVERMRRALTNEWVAKAAARHLTIAQAVTLASLIEKETGRPEERKLISAVFHNRLRRGQRLECDPTVIYAALVSNRFRGTIFKRDLAFDSPYNTYLRAGLPVGPIASPSQPSLEAAVDPAPVDFLYFVSDAAGGHAFSRTLAEHHRAVERYRRKMRDLESAARLLNAPMNASDPTISGKPGPSTSNAPRERPALQGRPSLPRSKL